MPASTAVPLRARGGVRNERFLRLRLHCHRLGLWGQRVCLPAGREGLFRWCDGNGPAVECGGFSEDQLGRTAMDVEARPENVRVLQYADLPPCNGLEW